jgi:hypothetical protein
MKKLQLLTAIAGVLLALAGPSLAAQRSQQAFDAYASGAVTTDRSGAYYYGPRDAQGRTVAPPAFQSEQTQYNRGQNLPYPDRPYGAPDTW